MNSPYVKTQERGTSHVVSFEPPNGVILPSDIRGISRALDDLLSSVESPELLLDLGNVQSSDGKFLGLLVKFRARAVERGAKLALVRVSDSLKGKLEDAGAASLFAFYPDESHARQAFAESSRTGVQLQGHVDWSPEIQDDTLIVRINTARLNGYDLVTDLAEGVEGILDDVRSRNLVVDFARVEFMTSSMLGKLLQLRNKLAEKGGKVGLVGLSAPIRSVFDTTQLESYFHFYGTAEEAVRDF